MNFDRLRVNIRTAALCLLLLALLANVAGAFSENRRPDEAKANVSAAPVKVRWMGQIESRQLNESSGLAASNFTRISFGQSMTVAVTQSYLRCRLVESMLVGGP